MQKEDLLKRLKIFATVATVAFVVLVVALIVQFGLIAHRNTELARLRADNAAKEQQLAEIQKQLDYYKSPEFKEDHELENA